jgi:Sec-independent protein secretion pathway component TatC
MLGWMIVFALLAILGALMTLSTPAVTSAMVGIVFALLFLLGLLTRLMRGRAW